MSHRKNRSFYSKGGSTSDLQEKEWTPKIDKNPYYRTMDIFNGVFKKNIKLVAGQCNSTDMKTITVNFGETRSEPIVSLLRENNNRSTYSLQCGHEFEGQSGYSVDGSTQGVCWICGADQSYLAFEHEWQHIIFKSDPVARVMFVNGYNQYLSRCLDLNYFLSLLVNVFDDIRCNSLWEKVYPGSASAIWERWRTITQQRGEEVNKNFVLFIFAVALEIPTNVSNKFEKLRPIIEWGVRKVRYRGFNNMLLIVRVVFDRCLDFLVANLKTQIQQTKEKDTQDSEDQTSYQRSVLIDLDSVALSYNKEVHHDPSPTDIKKAYNSQSLRASIAQVLSLDISDPTTVDQALKESDEPDVDMASVIKQLQDSTVQKTKDSQLTSNAKAKVLIINVSEKDVEASAKVRLTGNEDLAVNRMRSTFFKSLGRQKAKRSPEGNTIDVPAFVQFMQDQYDPEVFESEANHRGFAYEILCDMSGSMQDVFPHVCHAVEMLKQSLDFPFVTGHLWGFRGGDCMLDGTNREAELWMYRYHKNCSSYVGSASISVYGIPLDIPITCGGLTPMNSAINIAVNHLRSHISSGVSKRLFIITDGSPSYMKTNGEELSTGLLRQFVAKEINKARQCGIQVFTLVIGKDSIPSQDCKKMFGHSRFWKKTERTGPNSIDKMLTKLILENFTKYIKARG